ncbi:putative Sin3 binding protein-domain-containing protein [Lophiotrema nucula]|uniref:Putative Sin3 binding protein-domain-containing protein n=1 Tax=Lophiotrema nucula TaxID=690887 RepID=A0A6A5Z516_9PLEO|nr:putative Sin3 binding protein-domain-containing protein [Lophiotrema nucula]
MLPTPPNSISPTLPAHKYRPGLPTITTPHPPSEVDSVMDLQDAAEHATADGQPTSALSREALAGLEAEGAITAEMLAKHHLPGIFQGQDTLPIKDIMSHLAQNVPGYSRIPQAKARRLCVAALEYREGGGMHGDVIFEKVGWGRWSSHPKGQAPQLGRGVPIGGAARPGPTPPASVDSAGGLQIPKLRNNDVYSGSWAAGSLMSSRDEDMADRMSLDGSEDTESSASEMELDEDDDTDVEDWAAIGPQALREASRSREQHHRTVYRDYNYLSRTSGARFRSASAQSVPLSRSAGKPTTPAFNQSTSFSASRGNTGTVHNASGSGAGVLGTAQNNQEREAIEALLAMGSM